MTTILITGLAGTGKSTIARELTRRGFDAIDASDPEWSEWKRVRPAGSDSEGPRDEWLWQLEQVRLFLQEQMSGLVFVTGCAANQGELYAEFDHIMLLTASPERMIERLEPRWDLRIAEDRFERYLVLQSLERVLPMLRRSADKEIDTTNRGVEEVVEMVLTAVTAMPVRSGD